MRRGRRNLWREVAAAAQRIADSTNHAEEYMATRDFDRALMALLDRMAADYAARPDAGPPPANPK